MGSTDHERAVADAVLGGGAIELTLGAGDSSAHASGETSSDHEIGRILGEIDRIARNDAPLTPPALDEGAARWGLLQLTQVCLCVVDRTTDRDVIGAALDGAYESHGVDPQRPDQAWSADLCLRYLHCLEPQISSFVADDPVRSGVARLFQKWPLSGVGALPEDFDRANLRAVSAHPSLGAMLVDRVIARRDPQALCVDRVNDAVGRALGRALGWTQGQRRPNWAKLPAFADS